MSSTDDKKTWLLTWNKDKWGWNSFEEDCEKTKKGQKIPDTWACQSKQRKIGDEFFMIKLGSKPRGIFGHGVVIGESHEDEHYDPQKAAEGKKELAIDIEFDRLQRITDEPV